MRRAREIVLPKPHKPVLRNECLDELAVYTIQMNPFERPQFVMGNNTFDQLWFSGKLPEGSFLR